jgi:MarR family
MRGVAGGDFASFYTRVAAAVEAKGSELESLTADLVADTTAVAVRRDASEITRLRGRLERLRHRLGIGEADSVAAQRFDAVLGSLSRSLDAAETAAVMREVAAEQRREAGVLRNRVLAELRTSPLRPRELMPRLGADASQVSRALRDLEREDLIEEVPGPSGSDRRARWYRAKSALGQTGFSTNGLSLLSDDHRVLAELHGREPPTLTELMRFTAGDGQRLRATVGHLEAAELVEGLSRRYSLTDKGEGALARLAEEGFYLTLARVQDEIPADFSGAVAIAGPAGSGKRAIAQALAVRREWRQASIGAYIKSAASRAGNDPSVLPRQKFRSKLIEDIGWEQLLANLIEATGEPPGSGPLIIDGFRDRDELLELETFYEPTRVIRVILETPRWMRELRLRDELLVERGLHRDRSGNEPGEAVRRIVESADDAALLIQWQDDRDTRGVPVSGLPMGRSRLRAA